MMCEHSFLNGRCSRCGISEKVCRDAMEEANAYVIGSAYLTPEELAERIAKYEKRKEKRG